MRPEVKAVWTKALRSNEYRQGKGALRDSADNFCCLGVLCDLAVKAGLDIDVDSRSGYDYKYDGRVGGLPDSVRRWAGMDDSMGTFYDNGDYKGNLADTNDDGASFTEIADLIEKEF